MSHFITFSKQNFTKKINDYELIETSPINPSTMYTAIFKPLNFKCVLRKIQLNDNESNYNQIDLFINENNIDKTIENANIIEILISFIHNDVLYTIFPYSEYKSMDYYCKPYGILNENVIAYCLLDVLTAIDYLHRNNIIHRAIRGSHVLVFDYPQFKFVLTGLKYSYHIDHTMDDHFKLFKYPKNASKLLNYLAPEILEQNILGYDFKSDIYSLGIFCCELANGIIPFDNLSTDELLFYKIIGDIPKPLDRTCEEMSIFLELFNQLEMTIKRRYEVYSKRKFSKEFHDFTQKCLHLEPIERPNALDLLDHSFLNENKRQNQKRNDILKEFFNSK